jgi:hypothetical protein
MSALTSPTSGGRSVGIVRLRTKATELIIVGIEEGRERKIFLTVKTEKIDGIG